MNVQEKSGTSGHVLKAVTFLNHILPTSGFRAAFAGQSRRNFFFATNVELAQFILDQDRQGVTVYHACGSFTTNLNRTQANVQTLQSFWCDADCGEGKPFPDAHTAAEKAIEFCRAIGIPSPVFVASGSGLHLYWPLGQEIHPETWLRHATGLRLLCQQHAFEVDHHRTCDSASVLRTPGTHNRKHGEVEVLCGPLVGPFELSDFDAFATAAASAPPRQRAPVDDLSRDLLGGLHDDRPSDSTRIAGQCAQIREFEEKKGCVPYEHWRSAIGIYAFCSDGRADAHLHSSGHPGYTAEETDRKLDDAERFGKPITCDHFRSINPQGCVGCPASGRITSPVELGRTDRGHTVDKRIAPGETLFGEQIRPPPPDFAYTPDGALTLKSETKDGKPVYDLVCKYPVYLKSVQTGELDTSRFGYNFRTFKPHVGWTDVIIGADRALGQDPVATMAGKGITIHNKEAWRYFVKATTDEWHMNNIVEIRYDQFGWKNESFLVGRRLYTPTEIRTVNGNDALQARAQYFDFPKSRNASLERWQRAANKMFAEGLEHQSLAILCGFAAPIMRFHSEGEGGAIVSFISDKTASGKSTALEAAASVWGQLRGIRLEDTDTRVAKGLKLGFLGNLPCTFDELAERDPEEIRKFVLTFTNGTDKDRGTIEGTLRINKAEWQTLLLLASNKSIVDTLSNFDDSDATTARVFELSTMLPSHASKHDFDEVRRELEFNHSFAGDAYIKKLVQPEVISWIRHKIPECTAFVRREGKLEERHRFWVRMIVSVIIAGTIVQKIGLLDFSVNRIRDWLLKTANDQRDQIAGNSRDDAANALGTFINHHIMNMLVVDHTYKPGQRVLIERPAIGKLFIRNETASRRMYIMENELHRWLASKSINIKNFVKTLTEQGVILGVGRKHTLGAGTNFAGKQVPCYVINMASPRVTGMPVEAEEAYPNEAALPPEL